MKLKIFFSVFIFTIISIQSFGQFTVEVSGNATSGMHTGDTIYGGNHHICFNSYLYYKGNNYDTLYLEDQVTLTILWSDNLVIYADTGAVVNYSGSGNNIIKSAYYDSSVTNIDTIALNVQQKTFFSGLTWDYSNMANQPGLSCTFSGSGTTSTPTLKENHSTEISIFPNPFSDLVTIESSEKTTVYIFNILGNLIKTKKLDQRETVIDLDDIPSGIYLIKTEGGSVQRICKK